MGQLQQMMQPLGPELGQTPPEKDPQAMARIDALAQEVQREATPLPSGVAGVVSQVTRSATSALNSRVSDGLDADYQANVVNECKAVVGTRYPFNPAGTVDVPLADFGRLFGYNGLYDAFFRDKLANLVDTTRPQWEWKTLSGSRVGGSAAMLRQFQVAERIRQLYFRQGSQDPQLQFTLTPTDLDAAALRFTLDVDGQSLVYRHDAPRAVAVTWPGPKPNLVVATFDERNGGRPNLVFEGPWAWLRMVNAARVDRESEVRYVMTIAAGGHEARLTLEAPSLRNPYASRDLQQFRCE
jgi:type VI secretion system protein ImpL